MRRALPAAMSAATLAVVAAFMVVAAALPAGASSGTTLSNAAAAISQGHHVYVDGATPGTDDQTTEGLLQQLDHPDNTVLVMVPAAAVTETSSAKQFASQLDDMTGRHYIIGVAFVSPDQTAVYATGTHLLPHGTSDSDGVMDDAMSVGTGPVSTLDNFALYMHQQFSYESHHQPAKGTRVGQPAPESHGGGFPLLVIVIPLILLAGLGFLAWRKWLKSIPGLLWQISKVKEQFDSFEAKEIVESICEQTNRYLTVTSEELSVEDARSARRNTLFNLRRVLKVVRGYAKMELRPNEWPGDTNARLEATRQKLAKFTADLLHNIQLANEGRAAEFEMDTSVLADSMF